jgi:arabinogalactan endo-1,4-beta-galactosidase
VKTQSFVTSYGVHYDPKEYTFAAQYDNQVQTLCGVLCALHVYCVCGCASCMSLRVCVSMAQSA